MCRSYHNADGKALRNILENGLLIKDVGLNSNDLMIIYAAAASPRAMMGLVQQPVTNLTNDPRTALQYAQLHNQSGNMMVVVKVSGIDGYDDIVRVEDDIPANQIEEMLVCVSWNGTPVWARVTATPDGFELTPYALAGTAPTADAAATGAAPADALAD